jgi:15-cis-phytoene synthase
MRIRSSDTAGPAVSDLRDCRALLRGGSRSFFAASLLLPREVRNPASALYAFCRLADDAVDIDARKDAIAHLRERLRLAYDGRPLATPVDRAFANVVACHEISPALPEALLEGLEWDASGVRYETLADLEEYAARVAGAVGCMMAILMGKRQPDVLARACDLGVAMQLTNIARDVGEDGRNGRLYLPQLWLRQAGIEPERWLARPGFSEPLGAVVQRVLAAADTLYARAAGGIAQLPPACRPGIHAARLIYADIGREIRRNGYDSVTSRAAVPAWRKGQLLGRALVASGLPEPPEPAGPLDATRFLVTAAGVTANIRAAAETGRAPRWSISHRVVWLLELFERLERGQQA